jgi:hypothetical protein
VPESDTVSANKASTVAFDGGILCVGSTVLDETWIGRKIASLEG